MNPRFGDFAADPDVRGPARQSTEDALRRSLEYFLYRDLERGWRVTAPNLEDCGLLRFDYEGLRGADGLLAEDELWEAGFTVREGRGREGPRAGTFRLHPRMRSVLAPADLREEVVRTLLDVIRRSACGEGRRPSTRGSSTASSSRRSCVSRKARSGIWTTNAS